MFHLEYYQNTACFISFVTNVCACLRVCSAAVESTGAAKAEAQSRAEAARIQGEAAVEEAKLKVEAQRIEAVSHPSYSAYECITPNIIQSTVLVQSRQYAFVVN